MTYEENFNKLKEILMNADAKKIDGKLALQFNIEGDGEGVFYVEVKDGQVNVEPYEYYDRDAVFIATANVFTKLVEGKLNPVLAFSTGKLKVEGDLDKALEIQKIILPTNTASPKSSPKVSKSSTTTSKSTATNSKNSAKVSTSATTNSKSSAKVSKSAATSAKCSTK